MVITDNNLRVPDELWDPAAKIAERQGRKANDLAADALARGSQCRPDRSQNPQLEPPICPPPTKTHIAHEKLEELSRYGRERAKELGLDKSTEEQGMAFVERLIGEDRIERRR